MNSIRSIAHKPPAAAVSGEAIPAVISLPQRRQWFNSIEGERIAIVVHSDAVDGAFAVLDTISAPGTASPLHYHREGEIFHILEGVVAFACGGKTCDAGPGTTVFIPAGAHHCWRNRGPASARMLVTFVPGGVEDLFIRLEGLAPTQIAELAARYGTYVVGPPLA